MPSSHVNAFIAKLWRILRDESLRHLIHWDQEGTGFVISDPSEFSRQVLPAYYKHSNLASFIRQLNAYEFRKCSSSRGEEVMEYRHPSFLRDSPGELANIKRKTSTTSTAAAAASSSSSSEVPESSGTLAEAMEQISRLEQGQEDSARRMSELRRLGEERTEELARLRAAHRIQKERMERVLHFLRSLFNSADSGRGRLRQRFAIAGLSSLHPISLSPSRSRRPMFKGSAGHGRSVSCHQLVPTIARSRSQPNLPSALRRNPPPPQTPVKEESQSKTAGECSRWLGAGRLGFRDKRDSMDTLSPQPQPHPDPFTAFMADMEADDVASAVEGLDPESLSSLFSDLVQDDVSNDSLAVGLSANTLLSQQPQPPRSQQARANRPLFSMGCEGGRREEGGERLGWATSHPPSISAPASVPVPNPHVDTLLMDQEDDHPFQPTPIGVETDLNFPCSSTTSDTIQSSAVDSDPQAEIDTATSSSTDPSSHHFQTPW